MAETRITEIQSHIGTAAERASMDTTGLPIGSTFFETDTKLLYIWNLSTWTLFPAISATMDDLTILGSLIFTPSTTQVINAAGDAILANASLVVLDPDADYTLTSTPTIANGTTGQILYIACANGEANTVTIQDQDTLASTNLELQAPTRSVSGKEVISLYFDGTNWVEFQSREYGILTATALNVNLPADDNITIDGSTNPRTITMGVMRFLHTPAIQDTRAIHMQIDADSQADTHGMFIALSSTDLVDGEEVMGVEVTLDVSNATGGVLEAFRVNTAGAGTAGVHALHVDPGVEVIHQETGSFGAIEQGWKENGGLVDSTAAFNDPGTDLEIFSANGDKIYVGDAADFNSLQVNLATVASGAGVKPTFEFSIAGPGWTTFVPNDGTNGFRVSGTISWDESTLTNWAAVDVGGAAKKYIRVTRTQVGLGTKPVEDTIQVLASGEFGWDENAGLTIRQISDLGTGNNVFVGKTVYSPSAAQVIDSVGDAILANATAIELNPDGDYTLTSTPTIADGTKGQILFVTCANGESNTVTMQDQGSLGGSNLQLGAASRAISGRDILQLYFDGDDWIEVSFANN